MLSRFDDYCIHQTAQPIRNPATSDRNAYDRYWLNGLAVDGSLYFTVAFGRYPNRFVHDGAVCVVSGGVQHSFFGSRRAAEDPSDGSIGPFTLEVVDPMRVVRVRLAPNDSGLACDLTYSARSAAIEEARATLERDGMVFLDATRFTQFGRWDGWLDVDGRRFEVSSATCLGARDRSWGVRPLGEPEAGRPGTGSSIFWNWVPLQFEDCCVHAWRFEDADGNALQSEASIVATHRDASSTPVNPDQRQRFRWSHEYVFDPGTRRIAGGTITLEGGGGATHTIRLSKPLFTAYPTGLGYAHPEWGHGMWKGELATGSETLRTEDADLSQRRYQLMHNVVHLEMGDRRSIGIVEQSFVGPHRRYGFVGDTGVER